MCAAPLSPRSSALQAFNNVSLNDEKYLKIKQDIQAQLAKNPIAKEEASQSKLNDLVLLHKKALSEWQNVIEKQHNLHTKTVEKIKSSIFSISVFQTILLGFQQEQTPLLEEHIKLTTTVTNLENQIVSLLHPDTQIIKSEEHSKN